MPLSNHTLEDDLASAFEELDLEELSSRPAAESIVNVLIDAGADIAPDRHTEMVEQIMDAIHGCAAEIVHEIEIEGRKRLIEFEADDDLLAVRIDTAYVADIDIAGIA